MPLQTILICTVGGSHQPIIAALRELRPDFVCFVCSGIDPGTHRAGSDVQILGNGHCIKAHPEDPKPTLPNIPTQAGLAKDHFEVVTIPADDLDSGVIVIRQALGRLGKRFSEARLVADYTGGTKTMTAALVTAVLETDGVDLQLVTGNRSDLIKVRDGTEYSAIANIDAIRLERAMAPFLGCWQRFAYDEAAEGLAALRSPRSPELRARLARARDLSSAFAAWDRFDHAEARRLLEDYAPVVSRDLGVHLGALKLLTAPAPQQEPMQLFDLWRNAERRAEQGRYDDAVARCYRLMEWTAQWLLRARCGIDTADVPLDRIPAGMQIQVSRDGRLQAGLFTAWGLMEKLMPKDSPAGVFTAEHLPALQEQIKARNSSILAHGFTPIGRNAWEKLKDWMGSVFIPMLLAEAKSDKALRIHSMPPQLPPEYKWRE